MTDSQQKFVLWLAAAAVVMSALSLSFAFLQHQRVQSLADELARLTPKSRVSSGPERGPDSAPTRASRENRRKAPVSQNAEGLY